MGVSDREIISIVQLVVYIPIFLASLFVTLRHGFTRDLGWVYLSIFALARVVGAVLFIILSNNKNPSEGLEIATFVIQSAAVSPLMLATAGFLGVVAQGATLPYNLTKFKRLMHIVLIIALILAIVAGTELSNPSDLHTALTLRKVSSILFVVIYGVFVLVIGYFWLERPNIQLTRRHLLLGISLALPFLGARLAYSVGGAFTPLTSIFSITVGNILLYGLLAVLPEFIVVLIYTCFGIFLRLDDDPISNKYNSNIPLQDKYNGNRGYTGPTQTNGGYA